MKKHTKTLLLLSVMTGLSISSPFAQQQGKSNAKASGWFKTCEEKDGNKLCNVQYRVVTAEGNQLLMSLNLVQISGKVTRDIFRIVVPTGRSLPAGIQLQVDGKRAVNIPYAYCRPQICAAEARLDDNIVKTFKAGGRLDVTTINFQNTKNPVPITLKGFTAAFDGPPVKLDDLASREEKLRQQVKDKLQQPTE